jgi:hypothetical protein
VTPSKFKLSTLLKNHIDSLIKLGLPTKRIYLDVLCNDNLREEHLPLLSWIQAYVNRERYADDDEWHSVFLRSKNARNCTNREWDSSGLL